MGTRLRLRSRWVILVATLPAATAQAGCGSGNQTGCPAKVQAAYIPAGTFPLVMVAKDAGIFPRHQLDVTLTPTQNISAIPPTLGRQFEVVPATAPDLIKAVARARWRSSLPRGPQSGR